MKKYFKLRQALALFNARIKAKNIKAGIKENTGLMSQQDLGTKLYPDSSYDSIAFNMTKMMKKDIDPISVKIEMVKEICKILGVDENFLFSTPSVFDKEYAKYFGDGK